MSDFRKIIDAEARNVCDLQGTVHATYERRDQSSAAMDQWRKACHRFRQYDSLIGDWLRHIEKDDLSHNPELKDFAITFLEMDPMYFRSGYIKGRILRRLKSTELDKTETTRTTAVLVDAVRRRAGREFREYCRLAATLGQEKLVDELSRLAESSDGQVTSRAKLMLQYVQSSTYRGHQ